jgi:hypothetical protein
MAEVERLLTVAEVAELRHVCGTTAMIEPIRPGTAARSVGA